MAINTGPTDFVVMGGGAMPAAPGDYTSGGGSFPHASGDVDVDADPAGCGCCGGSFQTACCPPLPEGTEGILFLTNYTAHFDTILGPVDCAFGDFALPVTVQPAGLDWETGDLVNPPGSSYPCQPWPTLGFGFQHIRVHCLDGSRYILFSTLPAPCGSSTTDPYIHCGILDPAPRVRCEPFMINFGEMTTNDGNCHWHIDSMILVLAP